MVTRQPVKVRRGRSAQDVFTGLAALVALIALLAGVPFALITFFGSPVPEELPQLDTLTQQLGPSTLIDVLVILVWLAWRCTRESAVSAFRRACRCQEAAKHSRTGWSSRHCCCSRPPVPSCPH
jgi:hypothetical protein